MPLALAVLALGFVLPTARAEESDDKKFEVTGELRVRYDRLDNYFDFDHDEGDQFSLWPYRAVVGLSGKLAKDVNVVLQVQNFGAWGNQSPVQGLTFPPFQSFDGDGSEPGGRRSETSLYQGYLTLNNIGGSHVNLDIGRKEFSFGSGIILGDEPFYNGTTYDGIRAAWQHEDLGITGFYYHITERNDPVNGDFPHFTSDDANMYGVIGSYHLDPMGKSDLDAYVIRYADHSEDVLRPNFYTVGARWGRNVNTIEAAREFGFDWNAEFAIQRGHGTDDVDGEKLDLGGWMTYDWLGFNIPTTNHLHRIYGSFLLQSGDDDLTDSDIKGWIPLFPTTHGTWGIADYFDSNFAQNEASIKAYSLGYSLTCKEKHMIGLRAWRFEPVEDRIDFLLVARPSGEPPIDDTDTFQVRSYGNEYDLTYDYRYSEHVTLGAGFALLKPLRGIAGLDNPTDRVTRAWAQASVKF